MPFSVPHTDEAFWQKMMHEQVAVLAAQPVAPTPVHAVIASVSVVLPVALQFK